ncbi:MAG: N-carbamoylputrescine amidase [Rickettsiales bacterium]
MTDNATTVAALQLSYGDDMKDNIAKTAHHIERAAKDGAQVVLPSELFQGQYFCTKQDPIWFETAHPAESHPCVVALRPLAKALKIVIPVSIFERAGPEYYNSVVMIGDAGDVMGTYRKTHIPDGVGYQEKYYFKPGNTGFKVWHTRYGAIGVGICWDQWFPEAARAMALQGAEFLFYPTAIGSEPYDAELDSSAAWRRAMQGHAVCNAVPVVAANRVGKENANDAPQDYYGHSFICGQDGDMLQSFGKCEEGALLYCFDRDALRRYRAIWGFFRDRRPNCYADLTR